MLKIINYKKAPKFKILLVVIIVLFCLSFYKGTKKTNSITNHVSSATIPNGLGVSIHFLYNKVDVNRISDAGFNIVRRDIFWSEIEKKKGVYNFKRYDTLTRELIKEDLRPYFILDYSNLLYEKNGAAIVTKKGREAFNRYVMKTTQRYKNKGVIWEIWNEPNTDSWLPKPNIIEYSLLLKQTSKTIKNNDPTGIVVAPALAGITGESLKWLEEIFKQNILDYVDAISVHPYRSGSPESVTADYQSLRTLIEKYSSKQIPIISGEWGYSTAKGRHGGNLSEEQQGAYLVRMFLINKLNNIPISIWYDWKNDGDDKGNREHNFGLRQKNSNVPKLAYHAMNTFTDLLSEYQLIERIETSNPDDYLLKFANNEKKIVLVMWTVANNHDISLPLKPVKGQVITMLGKKKGYFNSDINPYIGISDKPIYLIVD